MIQRIGAGRLEDDFLKIAIQSGHISRRIELNLYPHTQRPGGSLGKTLVFTRLKFTANTWPLLVNHTKHGVSVQGRTPAIFQPRHAPPAPLIYFNKIIGHSGIANEHYF